MIPAIVGANWEDEGKGKLTDVLAEQSDIVVRYQGGANAGHTIINEHGKFALHLLPSGIFHQSIVNIIGPGVALDIEAFFARQELKPFAMARVPAGIAQLQYYLLACLFRNRIDGLHEAIKSHKHGAKCHVNHETGDSSIKEPE